MKITIDTDDADSVGRVMRTIFRDQLPYARTRTVNTLAKGFQKRQRDRQRRIFTVRRPQFVDRAVKLKPFATKAKPEATISIDPPGGQERADILTKFEEDTEKRPRSGKSLAIPAEARRTKAGIVSKADRLSSLDLVDVGPNVAVGKKRTVLIRWGEGEGAVFRRVGRGSRSYLKPLFFLVPRATIFPDLRFVETAEKWVAEHYDEVFGDEFDRAVRSAR